MAQHFGRITDHPILGKQEKRKQIAIYFDGKEIIAFEGETVAAALVASGVRVFRHSHKKNEPRGIFCAIGHCTDCAMQVNGVENTKVCVTFVSEGMQVISD